MLTIKIIIHILMTLAPFVTGWYLKSLKKQRLYSLPPKKGENSERQETSTSSTAPEETIQTPPVTETQPVELDDAMPQKKHRRHHQRRKREGQTNNSAPTQEQQKKRKKHHRKHHSDNQRHNT